VKTFIILNINIDVFKIIKSPMLFIKDKGKVYFEPKPGLKKSKFDQIKLFHHKFKNQIHFFLVLTEIET